MAQSGAKAVQRADLDNARAAAESLCQSFGVCPACGRACPCISASGHVDKGVSYEAHNFYCHETHKTFVSKESLKVTIPRSADETGKYSVAVNERLVGYLKELTPLTKWQRRVTSGGTGNWAFSSPSGVSGRHDTRRAAMVGLLSGLRLTLPLWPELREDQCTTFLLCKCNKVVSCDGQSMHNEGHVTACYSCGNKVPPTKTYTVGILEVSAGQYEVLLKGVPAGGLHRVGGHFKVTRGKYTDFSHRFPNHIEAARAVVRYSDPNELAHKIWETVSSKA